MKRAVMLAFVAVAVVAAAGLAAQGTKYGQGVSLKAATTVEALLAKPETFLGKTVRVDGIVTAVCDKAGCWMELADEKAPARTLRFKVQDGVIVFPVAAKGKKASAEGVFEKVSPEMAKEYAMDQKESKGGDTKNAVPSFQVKATGAVIY